MPHTRKTPPAPPFPEKVMSPTVEEIRRTAEARLRELAPLLAEAAQLEALLAALDAPDVRRPSAVGALPAPAPLAAAVPEPVAPAPRRGAAAARRGRDGRAPQGSNKRTIMDIVAANPGIAAPDIAEQTGMKRTVVASTISRLKRTGELEAEGAGVRLAHVIRAA
jgi:Winged helix-turn-helix DNA-binding